MGKSGAIIFSLFGAVWLVIAKINGAPLGWWGIVGGAIVSALLIGNILTQKSPISDQPSGTEQKRIGRIFMWSSMAEGAGILLAVNILDYLGMADRYLAGIALIVGLHFIPIGLRVPSRLGLFLAAVFMALSVAGLVIPLPATAALVVGCAGAGTLWCAAISIIRRRHHAAMQGH